MLFFEVKKRVVMEFREGQGTRIPSSQRQTEKKAFADVGGTLSQPKTPILLLFFLFLPYLFIYIIL